MRVRVARVKVAVLRTAGTNCDAETAWGFELAGAKPELCHVEAFVRREKRLEDYAIWVLPGGFTYGDDVSAGKLLANELRYKLAEPLERFLEAGKLILGICNGFQALVKAGLLPRGEIGAPQVATLTRNDSGRFEARWVHLGLEPNAHCAFTREMPEVVEFPVAHGEGKFVMAESGGVDRLAAAGQVVLRYRARRGDQEPSYPDDPNGSQGHVAGICDPSGRIFGLMPHPERALVRTQHPRWTRCESPEAPDGLWIFKNAVAAVKAL